MRSKVTLLEKHGKGWFADDGSGSGKELGVNKRLVLIVSLASYYAGFVFGWFVVVFVGDGFFVFRVLVVPILGAVDVDGYVIDSWYEKYRRDFMPDSSGRIFKDKKAVQKRVDTPVRKFDYVGHNAPTNPNSCGKFLGWGGCLRHDPVWAFKILKSCDSPRCSVCVKSWAGRFAGDVEARLVAASEVFGDIEHIVCSLRKEDYDLSYKQMKAKCIEILKFCSIIGGNALLHGKSFGKYRPHFHVLGFVGAVGGAERCRRCKGGDCYQCDGIQGRCYRVYQDTGYIVRVFDKRKTIRGTISYEAKHCTIDYSKRRFRVGFWFGKIAYSNYSKLGVKVEKGRLRCPDCGSVSGRIDYIGERVFDLDVDSPNFVRSSHEPLMEGGKVVWVVHEFKSFEGSE